MTTISQNNDSTKGIWVEGGCKESVLNKNLKKKDFKNLVAVRDRHDQGIGE